MRKEEFLVIAKLHASFWGEDFDDFKIETWFKIFEEFKFEGLRLAIMDLAKEQKFAPKISEIIEKYKQLKYEQTKSQMEESKKEIALLTAGQEKCAYCKNKGFIFINPKKDEDVYPYEYYTRCICPHGRDLSVFSPPQQRREVKYINPITNKEEDIYIPTFEEALGKEEAAIFKAEMVVKKAEDDSDKAGKQEMLEEKLKKMFNATQIMK